MPSKKLALMAAVLILSQQIGSGASAAIPTDDVDAIRSMVSTGQAEALRDYLAGRPELLDGDSPLSRALIEFFESGPGLFERLGFVDRDSTRLANLAEVALVDSIY